jgi:hypothetical protein
MRALNKAIPPHHLSAMTLPKTLLPIFAAAACFSGCVYDEPDPGYYGHPRRAYYGGGYPEHEVVVHQRPDHYYDNYYDDRPRAYYDDRPRVYGGGYAAYPAHRGETAEERRRREIREAQHHDEKKDDHKKKKKKKDDD